MRLLKDLRLSLIPAMLFTGLAYASDSTPEPGGFDQAQRVQIGSKHHYRGWTNSMSGVMAEVWNYIVYGHGRRDDRAVYGLVPGELPPQDDGKDQGGDTGGDEGTDTGGDEGTDTGGDEGTDTGGDEGTDTGGDEGTDTGGDEGTDTGGDTGGDEGTDTGGDTGDDSGTNGAPGDDDYIPDNGYRPDLPPAPETAPVPEPGTLMALLAGAAGSYLCRRRRKRRNNKSKHLHVIYSP